MYIIFLQQFFAHVFSIPAFTFMFIIFCHLNMNYLSLVASSLMHVKLMITRVIEREY